MIRRFKTTLAAALLAGPALAGDTYTVDKVHSEASFSVRHLGLSKVRGKFNDFDAAIQVDPAKPEASSVEFTVKTASIDTADPKRDTHLRSPDFFDSAKHALMTFKSTSMKAVGKDRYQVTGSLTIRGVSRQVTLPVTVLGPVKDPWGNEKAAFEVTTTINRKDFGLVWNQTLDNGGLLVGDDVEVSVVLETARKKESAPAK